MKALRLPDSDIRIIVASDSKRDATPSAATTATPCRASMPMMMAIVTGPIRLLRLAGRPMRITSRHEALTSGQVNPRQVINRSR